MEADDLVTRRAACNESLLRAMPDYLIDARMKRVPYMKLKGFIAENLAANSFDLFAASTKFALIVLAEKHSIKLEPYAALV